MNDPVPSDRAKLDEAVRLLAEDYSRLKELRAELVALLGDSSDCEEQRDILDAVFARYLECHHKFRAEILIIIPPHP